MTGRDEAQRKRDTRMLWRAIGVVGLVVSGLGQATGFQAAGHDASGRTVAVLQGEIVLRADQYVPYAGASAITRREFPAGFPRSMGSGICFKGRDRHGWTFWALGDRGPNGDGPQVVAKEGKIFPAADFVPAFGLVSWSDGLATLAQLTAIRDATGLPPPVGAAIGAGEVALSESLRAIAYDPRGVDPEAVACSANRLWVSEEYGPSVLELEPGSGRILTRFAPGDGLPAIFARRRINRGMEALTFDAESGMLVGALQSPIDDGAVAVDGQAVEIKDAAPFIRWVELQPASRRLREFAYPVAASDYAGGKCGHAKLGDVAAVGRGRFIVIEEGDGAEGQPLNRLYLVDMAGASDIHGPSGSDLERSAILGRPVGQANWRAVSPLRKRLLVDLRALGWQAEKAEGLALVDGRTLALTNDNDYGMQTALVDATGVRRVEGNVEWCAAKGDGTPLFGPRCPTGAHTVAMVRLPQADARQHLWLLRFAQDFASY